MNLEKKRGLILWLAPTCFSFIVLTITGCGGKYEEDKVTLRFLYGAGVEENKCYQKIFRSFEEEHPNIKIIPDQYSGGAYRQKFLTQIAGGTPPDILFLCDAMIITLYEKGLIENLTPYIEKDSAFDVTDFYPEALKVFKFGNKIYGLPKDCGPAVLFYNKDMFDKEGIPYPDETWTWEDLIKYGKKLTKFDDRGNPIQFGLTNHIWGWEAFVLQNGGEVINKEGTKCVLDSPEAIEAIEFVRDLSWKYHIAPTPAQLRELPTAGMDLFQSKKAAMSIMGRWMVPAYRAGGFDFDVAPLPKGKKRATFLVVSGYVIPSGSKHKKEAWEFLRYLTSKEGEKIMTKPGLLVPARKSVAESDIFLSSVPPYNNRVFIEEKKHAKISVTLSPFCSRYPEEWDKICQALELIWVGSKDPKSYLPKIVSEINAEINTERPEKSR
ncbi:sugar ABC transporter substrate-binding protein [Candidatus Calescamantes bacterium]|nr:sugar ABC transporter substrate-binding protein [Candidatus Calescamantes bacterium]